MSTESEWRHSKKGYLAKQGGSWKTWKRRWFVLQEGETLRLAYYTNEQEAEELGTIDLMRCSGLRIVEISKGAQSSQGFLFELLVKGRTYLFATDSAQLREDWFDMLEAALKRYNVLMAVSDDSAPVRTGYLYKQGGRNKNWRKRYFVVQSDTLLYYKKEKDTKPIGRLNLHSCNAITWGTPSKRFPYVFEIATPARVYVIAAGDEAERDEWMAALEECVPDLDSSSNDSEPQLSDDEEDDTDAVAAEPTLRLESPLMTPTPDALQDVATQPAIKQGFLQKQGGFRRISKKRWFTLKGAVLFYQKTENDKKPLGHINLTQCTGLHLTDKSSKKAVKSFSFEIDTPGRVYVVTAASEKDRSEWMAAIEDAIPEEFQLDDDASLSASGSLGSDPIRVRSKTEATVDLNHPPAEKDSSDDEYSFVEEDEDVSAAVSIASKGGGGLTESLAAISGDVIKSGYLKKEGGSIRTWKKRFFVLRGSSLMYFKSEKDRSPQGIIDLARCTSVDNRPAPTSKNGSWGFDLVTPQRTFAIEAENEQLRAEWVAVILPVVISFQTTPTKGEFVTDTPTKTGFLEKRGGSDSSKPWKKRYFVLMGSKLFYYHDEKMGRALGFADLRECRGIRNVPSTKYTRPSVFELCTSERTFVLSADSADARADWTHALAERVPEADIVSDKTGGPGRGGITADAVKVGILEKRMDLTNDMIWIQRLFVLTRDTQLLIFRSDKDRDPIETVDLNACKSVNGMPKHSIDRPYTFSIFVKPRLYIVATNNSKDLCDWMDLIADAVPEDDAVPLAERETIERPRSMTPVIQSYLYKQSEHHKAFRRRWFTMRGNDIVYYKRKRDMKEVGVITLSQLGDAGSSIKPQLSLETPNGFAIITPDRTFYLGAESDLMRQKWVEALQSYLASRRKSENSS